MRNHLSIMCFSPFTCEHFGPPGTSDEHSRLPPAELCRTGKHETHPPQHHQLPQCRPLCTVTLVQLGITPSSAFQQPQRCSPSKALYHRFPAGPFLDNLPHLLGYLYGSWPFSNTEATLKTVLLFLLGCVCFFLTKWWSFGVLCPFVPVFPWALWVLSCTEQWLNFLA